MQEEIWRPIIGYEGAYEVSNMGRIKQLERSIPKHSYKHPYRHFEECIIEFDDSVPHGKYYSISLIDNHNRSKGYLIHRLVATAFCINPLNKPIVDHKNGNTHDNRASNLRWVTVRENNRNVYPYNLPLNPLE